MSIRIDAIAIVVANSMSVTPPANLLFLRILAAIELHIALGILRFTKRAA